MIEELGNTDSVLVGCYWLMHAAERKQPIQSKKGNIKVVMFGQC